MIIVAIKLKNGTQLLCEFLEELKGQLHVRDVIAFKETIFTPPSSTPYIMNIPYLYFPHGRTMEMKINLTDVLHSDIVDDYTEFYYSSVYYDLIESENRKREFVISMYDQAKSASEELPTEKHEPEDISQDLSDDIIESILGETQKPTLH